MAMGRPPKPVEEHLRNGTYRADRHAPPVLVSGRPTLDDPMMEPPDDLPEDGKKFWRAWVTRLIEVGLIDRVDQPALEGLCTMFARAVQARRVIAQQGHF